MAKLKKKTKKKATPAIAKQYDGSTPLSSINQEMFVNNILRGLPQYKAYDEACYKPGQNENTLLAASSRLLTKVNVQLRLAYRREEIERDLRNRLLLSEAQIVNELALLARSNMQDFVYTDKDGNFKFKSWDALSREQLAAVESVSVTEQTTKSKKGREYVTRHVKFKLHSKTSAIELLGKHLGIFERDNKQRTPKTVIVFKDSTGRQILSNIIDQPAALPAPEPEVKDG